MEMEKSMNLLFRITIVFLLFLYYEFAPAQDVGILAGIVRDKETNQPLPGTSIRILETSKGTITNAEGAYRISLIPGTYEITFSYIGYRSDTLKAAFENAARYRDIYLQPTTVNMPDVVVIGADRDQAEEIILEAIRRKHRILSQLQSYQFEAYTKTEVRMRNPKKGKQDTLIAGIFETETSCSWKAPDSYKEVITARRQTANIMPKQNILTVNKIPNLNDDIVVLEPCSVIGPTAQNALEYYTYQMLDTLAMDNYRVFRIRVKPKSRLRPLFDGVISIADKSFMIMEVDVQGNEALDLSPLTNPRMRQRFALFESKYWLPVEYQLIFNIEIQFPMVPKMYVEQYSLMHNYEINRDMDSVLFDNVQITVLPVADRRDTTYWQNVNTLPLTTEEALAYKRMDSIVTNAGFFSHAVMALMNFSVPWKNPEPTSFADFFHFNRIEGAYLGAGLKVSELLPHSTIIAKGAYAFAENRGKYSIDVEHFLTARKTLSLGAGLYRKILFREGEEYLSPGEITWLALLDHNDPVDYFENSGWSLYSRVRPETQSMVEIRLVDERHSSLAKVTNFSLFSRSKEYRPNPPIIDGKLRSGSISFEYDTRKFMMSGMLEEFDRSQNSIWCTLSVEHSTKNILQSDFQYTRVAGSMNFHVLATSSGAFYGNLRFGYADGSLPPQKIFEFYGSTSDITVSGSLRTVGIKEFAGDRMASLILEYNFGSLPFRALGVPLMKSMDFILFSGTAWADLSPASRAIQPVMLQTSRKVINEIGFGIGRLFTLFRLDFAWRVTGNTKNNFTLTLGSSFL